MLPEWWSLFLSPLSQVGGRMTYFPVVVAIAVTIASAQVHAADDAVSSDGKFHKRSARAVGTPSDEVEEPPEFIRPSSLGFFTAVGIPQDIFFSRGKYYLNRDSIWFRASTYRGPWVSIKLEHLPEIIRKHNYRDIIRIRDEEYEHYLKDEGYFRTRSFKPTKRAPEKRNSRGTDRTDKVYGED